MVISTFLRHQKTFWLNFDSMRSIESFQGPKMWSPLFWSFAWSYSDSWLPDKARKGPKITYTASKQFSSFSENIVNLIPMICDLWTLSQDDARPEWQFKALLYRQGHGFVSNDPKRSWWSYLRPMVMVWAQFGSLTFGEGNFRSHNGKCAFCFQLFTETRQSDADGLLCSAGDQTHRLICILTFPTSIRP